ncbi:MAG TPA: ABC transporter ATP-binding protein [Ferrovibrio sp.]|uniref:ABC transporter ATP-binding protein n=1 Tax=Ferrovibrio sp. TaxID=1917215 RepID=UPI002B4AFA94|nr:ABC transporter ATP-binding protein [Ferrovibrio sp.]HLT77482.1 ABC transporter ATP-binding protein [Ferrovibrio sp.]
MSERPRIVLELKGIRRTFRQGGVTLEVLRGIDLAVQRGETVALLGPSGSGKSTLLHIAGLLEKPSEGQVIIAGQDCTRMGEHQRTLTRRHRIGFVYQFHHLLPEFSALENAAMPLRIRGEKEKPAKHLASDILKDLGLMDRLDHRPARLSGGEQQRVAIARALVGKPDLLLADEPTGNLDEKTAETVFGELVAMVRNFGIGALIATHNIDMAKRMDRIVALHEGRLYTAASTE